MMKKQIITIFWVFIIFIESSTAAFASITDSQKKQVLDVLHQIQTADATDYYQLMPHLEQANLKEKNIDARMILLHHLALYYLTSDEFNKALVSLTELEELSAKNNNETMQSIAAIYMIVAKNRYKKHANKLQLKTLGESLDLESDLKLRVNYGLAYGFTVQSFAGYVTLEKLSFLSIELEEKSLFPAERFMILWGLSSDELNLDRRLAATKSLLLYSKKHNQPINRFILLHNIINYFSQQLGELSLAENFADAYIDLAVKSDKQQELFFALERKASI